MGSIRVNVWWQESCEKGNRKSKVNGFEASYALAILGIVVPNVVYVVHI